MATPEQYVAQAFTKCTSGVHHGWTNHEIAGLMVDQIQDIIPSFGSFAMCKIVSFMMGKRDEKAKSQ